MRIDWTEPLSKCLVRHRFGEARREAVSVMRLIGGCSVLAGLVCIAVRVLFPETSEVLSWYRILHTALVMLAAASPKIREEDVGKFLADIGQVHRVHLQR